MDYYNYICDKIKFLVDYLNECTKAYDEGNPKITDTEYDNKYFELDRLEKETGIILSNSPTQTINYEVVNVLNKVEHSHKMLSLDKTKSVDEVRNFIGNKNFLAMSKMDGLTCSITFKNGEMVSAETRGNGLVGEDILHNARILPSIPKHIPYTDELVIDGEIICTFEDFKDFNNEYKNPRNFAAGSIRLLNARECDTRKLTFVAWDVITPLYSKDDIEYRLSQKLDMLESFGFNVVPRCLSAGNFADYDLTIDIIKKVSEAKSYPIDGIVFKFDDCAYGRSLGETTHHFKNALAYKFADDVYQTKLINIEWSMGRTGQISPIALFETINIDGTDISRASLSNLTIMKQTLGEKPFAGQIIEVSKRNQIIPKIERAKDENGKWI